MTLNVFIVKSPAGVVQPASQKTFDEQGGTLGRGEANNWVLADPDRFLSSKHCTISCVGGQYYLTDTSTNGTFINNAPEPIGKGGKIPLNNNDTIEVGDYQFRVEVGAGLGALPASPFDVSAEASPSAPKLDESGLFSNANPFLDSSPFDNAGDPFALRAGSVSGLSLNPDPENYDPLAALDKAHFPESALVVDEKSSDLFSSNSHSDGAGALSQSVSWPDAAQENVIPEDWEEDVFGSAAAPHRPATTSPPLDKNALPAFAPSGAGGRSFDRLDADCMPSLPLTDPPKMPKQPAEIPPFAIEPLLAEREPEQSEPFRSTAAAHARAGPGAVPVATSKDRLTESQLASLIGGMGLSDRNLGEQHVDEIHALVGELVPVIVTGMMQVLRSRASIKNEFRMNVTTIQPIENNPLKFSATADEAIENMFVRKSSAYKQPMDAFKEGFDSIGEHQVAIIAGIRAAFKGMMDSFDPLTLEKQFDRQNKGVTLPGMQKARYWSSYTEYYKGFVDNLENSFQYLFGDDFVQAYEEQLRKLAAERKRNTPYGH